MHEQHALSRLRTEVARRRDSRAARIAIRALATLGAFTDERMCVAPSSARLGELLALVFRSLTDGESERRHGRGNRFSTWRRDRRGPNARPCSRLAGAPSVHQVVTPVRNPPCRMRAFYQRSREVLGVEHESIRAPVRYPKAVSVRARRTKAVRWRRSAPNPQVGLRNLEWRRKSAPLAPAGELSAGGRRRDRRARRRRRRRDSDRRPLRRRPSSELPWKRNDKANLCEVVRARGQVTRHDVARPAANVDQNVGSTVAVEVSGTLNEEIPDRGPSPDPG